MVTVPGAKTAHPADRPADEHTYTREHGVDPSPGATCPTIWRLMLSQVCATTALTTDINAAASAALRTISIMPIAILPFGSPSGACTRAIAGRRLITHDALHDRVP